MKQQTVQATRTAGRAFISVIFAIALAGAAAGVADAAALRVMDWNVGNQPNNSAQAAELRNVLGYAGGIDLGDGGRPVDLLALAETDPPSAASTLAQLDALYGPGRYGGVFTGNDGGGDSTGLVYNTGSLRPVSSRVLGGGLTHLVQVATFSLVVDPSQLVTAYAVAPQERHRDGRPQQAGGRGGGPAGRRRRARGGGAGEPDLPRRLQLAAQQRGGVGEPDGRRRRGPGLRPHRLGRRLARQRRLLGHPHAGSLRGDGRPLRRAAHGRHASSTAWASTTPRAATGPSATTARTCSTAPSPPAPARPRTFWRASPPSTTCRSSRNWCWSPSQGRCWCWSLAGQVCCYAAADTLRWRSGPAPAVAHGVSRRVRKAVLPKSRSRRCHWSPRRSR